WAAVVGRDIARRTRPDGLVNGTLRVVVDNSPWLHELTLRESELASMIRGRFPEVQALKLGLATLGTERAAEATPAPRPVPLTAADRADIDGAVAAIADAEVADTARRLMTTARRFPRSRQPSTPTHAGARGAE
ncbi:MAG TPA: DUF721 domain-containing protein, partial [Terriglobales bacterium]|nr:DUF721 domain-containing protein [Terriglobales bacterium]